MSSPAPTTQTLARRILQSASAEVASTQPVALSDADGGIHAHRRSVRRARAVLAGVGRVTDPADVTPLRAALTEWGRQLGEVRDAEVRAGLAEKALTAASAHDADARRRLVDDEREAYARLHARLVQLSDTPRARERDQLLRVSGLELRVDEPDAAAADVFARLLRREARRVRRAAEAAAGTPAGQHRVRKAARRLRYLAEAVRDADPTLLGKTPTRLAKAGRRIQNALGDERDAVLFLRRLEAARSRAAHAQESTAVYDELIASVGAREDARQEVVPAALRTIDKAARRLR